MVLVARHTQSSWQHSIATPCHALLLPHGRNLLTGQHASVPLQAYQQQHHTTLLFSPHQAYRVLTESRAPETLAAARNSQHHAICRLTGPPQQQQAPRPLCNFSADALLHATQHITQQQGGSWEVPAHTVRQPNDAPLPVPNRCNAVQRARHARPIVRAEQVSQLSQLLLLLHTSCAPPGCYWCWSGAGCCLPLLCCC